MYMYMYVCKLESKQMPYCYTYQNSISNQMAYTYALRLGIEYMQSWSYTIQEIQEQLISMEYMDMIQNWDL